MCPHMPFTEKYPNLGYMEKKRIPVGLHREMEKLLTELDRLAVRVDPCEILSDFCNKLSEMEILDENE